jgi:hypothetical protein
MCGSWIARTGSCVYGEYGGERCELICIGRGRPGKTGKNIINKCWGLQGKISWNWNCLFL